MCPRTHPRRAGLAVVKAVRRRGAAVLDHHGASRAGCSGEPDVRAGMPPVDQQRHQRGTATSHQDRAEAMLSKRWREPIAEASDGKDESP
jgi:hypothetical protein